MQEGRCTALMGLVLQGTDTAQQLKERFKNACSASERLPRAKGKL